MDTYLGFKLIVSPAAVSLVWNWPIGQRSKRLVKKMTKLRGPQVTSTPTSMRLGMSLIVHPEIYAELKRKSEHVAATTKYGAFQW